MRTFVRFKNPAQAAGYSSVVDIFPGSFTTTEHFTDGVEPGDDHNKQPEIEKNCVHPRIVSLKKNRGHEPHPKGDGNDPQTTCSAIRHEPFCIVALQRTDHIARFKRLFMPSSCHCWRKILGSYRKCFGAVQPGKCTSVSRRGICDRKIWSKPLAFAADAEGYK